MTQRIGFTIYYIFVVCVCLSGCQMKKNHPNLVFVSNKNGNNDIFIYNENGSQINQLTFDKGDDNLPSLSPNGDEIVFTSNRFYKNNDVYDITKTDLFILNLNNKVLSRLIFDPSFITTPSWSPDAKKLVFISNQVNGLPNIFISNRDGSSLKQLTTKTIDSYPTWSPDGKEILFSSQRGQNKNGSANILDLYKMNTDGTDIKRLTDMNSINISPIWSPDGKSIAFLSKPDFSDHFYDIFIVDANGNSVKRITNEHNVYSHISWTSDGKELFFDQSLVPHTGKTMISKISIDGKDEKNIIKIQDSFWPSSSQF